MTEELVKAEQEIGLDEELQAKLCVGKLTRVFKIGEIDVEISTLDGNDDLEVLNHMPANAATQDAKFYAFRRESLAQAIKKINNKELSYEQKKKLVYSLKSEVYKVLISKFDELNIELNKTIEEVKKK